ncbi:carbonic anhydrase [Bryobacter aggregatus]|uniref:carbonic anhydrase n=1 Tax=Bryobacter aggregatus TaxID=360054 RepID=UPI0005688A8B|nr:carbonic anhydrase [Bryobacter aggregatus]
MKELTRGVLRFETEIYPKRKEFFDKLIARQFPRALFITCSDSRVVPNDMTDSDAGDLFTIRNAGNIIPPYGELMGGVSATIEYAVMALGVKNIIVCGHTHCGAMDAVLHPEKVTSMPIVKVWLNHAESARRVTAGYKDLTEEQKARTMVEENVLAQLEHLRTHPSVAAALSTGDMNLFGWVFEIENGHVLSYDADQGAFVPLSEEHIPNATPRRRRRIL